MTTRTLTAWTILGCITALVGWDLYAMTNGEKGDTISEVLSDWSKERPVIAFLFGLLCGHVFWSGR